MGTLTIDNGQIKSIYAIAAKIGILDRSTHGYIGLLWFEELDQFAGPEEIRNVEQSTLRGGPYSLSIKSFNPPAATRNWANQYVREPKPRQLIKHTTYLQAPADWLGPRFLADAEHLKATKPTKYRHVKVSTSTPTASITFP